MSSVGQAAGGIVGGIVGFFTPFGLIYGVQIGMMIGGAIDPPKLPTLRGPRLDDLGVQTATYGAFIPRVYGTVAIHGNVFWVQGDKLVEVKKVTESGGKGGSTQTTETFEYFATFAVGLCEGPVEEVRRIWIGGQLWYDAGVKETPRQSTLINTILITTLEIARHFFEKMLVSGRRRGKFTLYKGTETQLADPLMQADKGVANVPAYRGLAYIVFDMLPLKDHGNSLMGAQVRVEIVKSGNIVDSVTYNRNVQFQLDAIVYNPLLNEIWVSNDQQNSTDPFIVRLSALTGEVVGGVSPGVFSSVYTPMLYDPFERVVWAYRGGTVSPIVYKIDAANGLVILSFTVTDNQGLHINPFDGSLWIKNSSGLKNLNKRTGATISSTDVGFAIYDVSFGKPDSLFGDSVIYLTSTSSGKNKNLYRFNPLSLTTDLIYTNVSDLTLMAFDSKRALLWITLNSADVIGIDINTVTVTRTLTMGVVPAGTSGSFVYDPLRDVLWGSNLFSNRISGSRASDGSIFKTFNGLETPGMLSVVSAGIFAIGTNPVTGYNEVIQILPDLVSSASPTLSSVVQSECLKSRLLTASDIDVAELTDSVRGYRIGALGAIRSGLDPLRAAWPFDVIQDGYKIKFKRRGSASVATIGAGELDARAAGDAPGVSITDVREMDLILPYKVSVKYLDTTREYDINEQYAERLNTDAVNEVAVDLPIVFTGSEAAGKAETLLYLYWLERYDVMLTLPPSYARLQAGDVITVDATFATYSLRLTSVHYLADGRIDCRAKYNNASIYTPTAKGEEGASAPGRLTLTGPTTYQLLDIPMLRDVDNVAGFSVAMTGYLAGWPGGVLFRSEDAGETWLDLVAFASPGTVMGYASNIPAAHGGTVYDFASTLTVRLYQGTLSSVTETQLFAAQNWFAYGVDGRWEIIAARTAILQTDGSYILRDFLRGQLGTEWATGLHALNDSVVGLNAADLNFVNVNSGTIGSLRHYRGITAVENLDSDINRAFIYHGVNLECLSPVHTTGNRHPTTNDWTLVWTRRTRFAGWRDLVDAVLGEATESYEVDIFSSNTFVTLKRTLTSATPTVPYTSANQVTDFGSNQATLHIKIYQLSATVGRGYPLTLSITR